MPDHSDWVVDTLARTLANQNQQGWMFIGRYPQYETERETYRERARQLYLAIAEVVVKPGAFTVLEAVRQWRTRLGPVHTTIRQYPSEDLALVYAWDAYEGSPDA